MKDFPKPKALNLHESKLDGIFVEGLAEYAVTHYLDCLELMKRGEKNRFIRQTSMNTKSSRSHTIFQILLESTRPDAKGMFRVNVGRWRKLGLIYATWLAHKKSIKANKWTTNTFVSLKTLTNPWLHWEKL